MASRTVPSVDDPAFQQLQSPRDPDSYRTQLARDLASLGRPKKARRLDDCDRFGHMQKCAQGHVTECVSHCGERCCYKCAERELDNNLEDWRLTADHLAKGAGDWAPARFTFLDIKIPCDFENVRELVAQVVKVMDRSRNSSRCLLNYSRMVFAAGFDSDSHLVVRVLAFDDAPWTAQQYRDALAGCEVEVSIVPTRLAEPGWFKRLFKVTLPKDSMSRAKMEIAFERLRRIRSVGFINIQENPEIIVEEDCTTTDNADDTDNSLNSDEVGSKSHYCKVCPRCGSRIVQVTNVYNRYARTSDPEQLGWHPPPN